MKDIDINVLDKLMAMVDDIKQGLDPETLASWYRVIETEAKALCPEKYRDSIRVDQDPILWMKFQLKASKHAVPYLVEVIENNLPSMPFSTRLYFQKLEEIIQQELYLL